MGNFRNGLTLLWHVGRWALLFLLGYWLARTCL